MTSQIGRAMRGTALAGREVEAAGRRWTSLVESAAPPAALQETRSPDEAAHHFGLRHELGFVHSVDRTRAAGYPRLTPHSQERVSHGNPAEGDYTGPAPVRGGVQRTGLGLGQRAAGGGHLGARSADRGRGSAVDGPERL